MRPGDQYIHKCQSDINNSSKGVKYRLYDITKALKIYPTYPISNKTNFDRF